MRPRTFRRRSSMIIAAIIAVSISSSAPNHAMQTRPKSAPMQIAGLFGIGKQKGFTEIVQKVQTEHDYAPPGGRQPERTTEPLVTVRYLTPEQRAEPIARNSLVWGNSM